MSELPGPQDKHRGDAHPIGEPAAAAADAIDEARPLSVVCWNVHKGLDPGLASELSQLAKERSADVVLLQEFRCSVPLPDGYFGHHARSFRRGIAGPDEGVTTLARVAAESAVRIRSSQRELMLLTPKAALVSRFATSRGRVLTCVNVHGLNFDPTGRQLAAQLEELRSFLDPVEDPVVVAGDFNTWNERRMDAVRDLADALGLNEILPDTPGGKTGALPAPRLEKLVSLDRRMHLDRLFVRGLRYQDATWLDTYTCSDHVPLAARLSWA